MKRLELFMVMGYNKKAMNINNLETGGKENKDENQELLPSVAEARVAELVAEAREVIPENQQKKAAEIEALLAEIESGKVDGVESQDQLASDYIAAYKENKKLDEEYTQNSIQLDDMREELRLYPNNSKLEDYIDYKKKEQALLAEKMREGRRKYGKIQDKLTDETEEKYNIRELPYS